MYDAIKRLSSVTTALYTKNYTYRDISANRTTAQISSVSYGNGNTYSYSYAPNGNISSETTENGTRSYTYDSLGQLTSATENGVTAHYSYDNCGNILSAIAGKPLEPKAK